MSLPRARRCMNARIDEELQCRAMRLLDPCQHPARIGRKLQLDRRRADEAGVADRSEIIAERRRSAPGRQVAVIEAVAIGDVDMRDPPAQPIDLALHLAHAPLGLVIRRVLAEISILIGSREVLTHRRRRFILERTGTIALLYFMNGVLTDTRLDLMNDDERILDWVDVRSLKDGERRFVDIVARASK